MCTLIYFALWENSQSFKQCMENRFSPILELCVNFIRHLVLHNGAYLLEY